MSMKELQSGSNKGASQIMTESRYVEKANKQPEKSVFKASLKESAAELPESIRKVKEEIRKKVEW